MNDYDNTTYLITRLVDKITIGFKTYNLMDIFNYSGEFFLKKYYSQF